MKPTRYAMHYLCVQDYRAKNVLVTPTSPGHFELTPFISETEKTIFFSGTACLYPTACGKTGLPPDTAQPATIEHLNRLLAHHPHWTLDLSACY